jgi:pSer/pThr/pTyr-binding forkhead associated (FHA) protein
MVDRETTQPADPPVSDTTGGGSGTTGTAVNTSTNTSTTAEGQTRGRTTVRGEEIPAFPMPARCINPASDVNTRLDTQVEVRVYPCNNSNSNNNKKRFTSFTIKPEGVVIQGSNRARNSSVDLGAEYAMHVGRKLQRYELSDTRACQLLVTTHGKSFWVVPAPEAFSRHSGTCRLLGDRKHPPAAHTLQVGDFLRVGSVGVVVIETHDGVENRVLSEERIQKIMKDTTNSNGGGFLDLAETDGGTCVCVCVCVSFPLLLACNRVYRSAFSEIILTMPFFSNCLAENSEDSMDEAVTPEAKNQVKRPAMDGDKPMCYMCFDDEDTEENPLITPCKCTGDTKYVHVDCLRKWHTAEADNQICFLSSVDATCSVCKSTFKSDFKLKDGRQVKLFKSSLEPPYVSLLVATKHEMAQRLFNTRFQLSFSTILKPDGRNATRPLLLGRSSASDMVLDYRTVSARHAAIRFKNGEFIFTDAGSSNGSYLYLRRPLELSSSQPVQFRLGRSMISMKVVNKWNRRLLRAVRRTGNSSAAEEDESTDDRSIGSTEGDVRVTDGTTGLVTKTLERRTRESVMASLPPPGQLSQQSAKHLDLLYALAYPRREKKASSLSRSAHGRSSDVTDIKGDAPVSPSTSGPVESSA